MMINDQVEEICRLAANTDALAIINGGQASYNRHFLLINRLKKGIKKRLTMPPIIKITKLQIKYLICIIAHFRNIIQESLKYQNNYSRMIAKINEVQF